MPQSLTQVLSRFPDKYPRRLAKLYPRILDKIIENWDKPEIDAVFADLLVADHQDRQGFPPEIATEIFSLFLIYQKARDGEFDDQEVDPWAAEREMTAAETVHFKETLSERGQAFTPEFLFKAVEQGETTVAFDFVRAGMAVDSRRADEWTPLMVALFNGHEETAMMLLSRGANVRAKAKRGYEPIHWAALNGYERAVKFIIAKGGNVNAETEYGWTPLLQAASGGHVGIARLLIDKGAMVNASEHEGWTPLHKACANGHADMVRLLVQRRADTRQRSATGITPLELAMKSQNFDLIEALSEAPLPPSITSTSPF